MNTSLCQIHFFNTFNLVTNHNQNFSRTKSIVAKNQCSDCSTLKTSLNESSKIIKLCKSGRLAKAIETLTVMDNERVSLSSDAYSSLLDACTKKKNITEGRFVHRHLVEKGFGLVFTLRIKLVLMYLACDELGEAQLIFNGISKPTIFSANSIIIAHTKKGMWKRATELYLNLTRKGLKPDAYTFSAVLKVCCALQLLGFGQQLHCLLIKMGFQNNMVLVSSLLAMYSQCGVVEASQKLFEEMPQRDIISWNSMLSAYSENWRTDDALKLYKLMRLENVKPNETTMVAALRACARSAYLQQGKKIHGLVIKMGFDSNIYVGSTLVDVYVESGVLDDAEDVFGRMPDRNVVTWTALIAGYGMSGLGSQALRMFHQMIEEGLKPNHVTLVSVLSACSHSGLVSEGRYYFNSMEKQYGIVPMLEHYSCMVDMLGRAALFDEAMEFIKKMPLVPDGRVWGALLGSCRIHGNIKLAEISGSHLFELEPRNAGNYIILSQIYSSLGRWNEAEKIRILMHERGVKKRAGCSWIEVKNQVHTFTLADTSHPMSKSIYKYLDDLINRIRQVGYVPNTSLVVHDVVESEKELVLKSHSEKLAISFGLISYPSPTIPIRIAKNLRICDDCHNATKYMSLVTGKEIIARDGNRFHHFSNGVCSCGDYW